MPKPLIWLSSVKQISGFNTTITKKVVRYAAILSFNELILYYILYYIMNIKKEFFKIAKEHQLGTKLSTYALGWAFLQVILSINDLFSEWLINDLTYNEWIEKKKKIYKNLIDFIIIIIISFILLKILNI